MSDATKLVFEMSDSEKGRRESDALARAGHLKAAQRDRNKVQFPKKFKTDQIDASAEIDMAKQLASKQEQLELAYNAASKANEAVIMLRLLLRNLTLLDNDQHLEEVQTAYNVIGNITAELHSELHGDKSEQGE